MAGDSAPRKKSKALRIPVAKRMALMKRLEAGETKQALANELGVTRQYVSLLWQNYLREGEKGLHPGKSGRKRDAPLDKAQQKRVHEILVSRMRPSEAGLTVEKPQDYWYVDTVVLLIRKELGLHPTRAHVADLLRGWGMRQNAPSWADEDSENFSQEYYDYINSPTGKEVIRRSAELAAQWEKEHANDKPKRGRPRKVPIEEDADLSGDAPVGESTYEDGDFDPEAYAELKRKMLSPGAHASDLLPPAPNQRVGKHRKATNRQKPKRKKKKKR